MKITMLTDGRIHNGYSFIEARKGETHPVTNVFGESLIARGIARQASFDEHLKSEMEKV